MVIGVFCSNSPSFHSSKVAKVSPAGQGFSLSTSLGTFPYLIFWKNVSFWLCPLSMALSWKWFSFWRRRSGRCRWEFLVHLSSNWSLILFQNRTTCIYTYIKPALTVCLGPTTNMKWKQCLTNHLFKLTLSQDNPSVWKRLELQIFRHRQGTTRQVPHFKVKSLLRGAVTRSGFFSCPLSPRRKEKEFCVDYGTRTKSKTFCKAAWNSSEPRPWSTSYFKLNYPTYTWEGLRFRPDM